LIFTSKFLVCFLLLLSIFVGSVSAIPVEVAPVPTLYVRAGTSFYGAVDLSHYYESSSGAGLRFGVTVMGASTAQGGATIVVNTRGPLLDISALSTKWTGDVTLQITACEC